MAEQIQETERGIMNQDVASVPPGVERVVEAALETYSNVHRGSGHHSLVSTRLFEEAAGLVLDHLGLSRRRYVVIFCASRQAARLEARLGARPVEGAQPGAAGPEARPDARLETRLRPGNYRRLSSEEFGLPLGLCALAVERRALPAGAPPETGGGTARLVGPGYVVWSRVPERFQPGTPAIVHAIAFAQALRLVSRSGTSAKLAAGDVRVGDVRVGDAGADDAAAGNAGGAGGDGDSGTAAIPDHNALHELSGRELLDRLRSTLLGHGSRVPTVGGEVPFINLDNAASTPTFAPVWDAVRRTWRQSEAARRALVEEARLVCAETLGTSLATHEVIFTSNTTEAINLVAKSLRRNLGERPGGSLGENRGENRGESLGKEPQPREPVVLNTLLEHNSDELPWRAAGLSLVRLPVDRHGIVDAGELELVLSAYNTEGRHGRQRIDLVAVCGASNVLGVFNDLAAISGIVHRHGARLLVDAAQWIAHRRFQADAWEVDYLAFSGHKVYAPFGSGVLLARKGVLTFDPAEMQAIRSSGEANAGGIAGLAESLRLLRRIGFDTIQEEEQALTRRALSGLAKLPRVKVYGISDPAAPEFARKGGVIAFDVKGAMPGRVARLLAERGGIGVRYGCHCSHLLIKHLVGIPRWAERVQYALVKALPRFELSGVVRVSFGLQNTEAEVDRFLEVLGAIAERPRVPGIGKGMERYATAAVRRVMEA